MITLRIGRATDNDVVINDPLVSRYHCQLTQYDDGRVVLRDNNSTNGTFVNGRQIYGEVTLLMTDTVMLGKTMFQWKSYIRQTYQGETQRDYRAPNYNNNNYSNNYNNYNAPHSNNGGMQRDSYPSNPPTTQLRTQRTLWKFILFSILTLGIYRIVVMSHISSEINYIASKYDHRNTPHYCLVYFLLSWLTLGIYPLVWFSNLSSRIGGELVRRNIPYSFGAGTFWGWDFFGIIIIVGPFIYIHKLFKAMNLLCSDYNKRG